MSNVQFHSDLDRLIEILPPKITKYLDAEALSDVIELVLDLGRQPEIRHSDGNIDYLGEDNIVDEDIKYVTDRVQEFTNDNRSGIPGTLHRISAIRNRQGKIVGLTCRIGRVVTGTIACIKDFVTQNKSILFLGRPGVGKTTKLREISRLVADEQREHFLFGELRECIARRLAGGFGGTLRAVVRGGSGVFLLLRRAARAERARLDHAFDGARRAPMGAEAQQERQERAEG